ncbi:putative uncharacterized protein DDB_G0282133 [Achroia grisella]|uniref:putative uncharacterized protein DDB_G0282133 n=1 Tax=Achroia grisella TaxID=688607 RepID=UPI0027D2EFD3|nr:putative uncharacterized protein DDB_G0282133 [Achroia grisella]
MSDSENDFLPNNVFTYQNENTTFSARGPNINATNLTGLSFRNNVLTSTMNMSRRFDNKRQMEHAMDSRRYYRRDVSPTMSLRSASDFRMSNYRQSHYPRAMSSQRSMFNGRSGSPMSVRSIDTTTSVSASDIALAFKNINFNKHDMKIIKEAYNKFMRRKIRKKIEKRRNLKLYLKGYRRKSGYDSGELGSDSSISSDGCRSTCTAMYKDNMSSCRSTRTDIMDLRRAIRENNMYNDCTESFKSVFTNRVPVGCESMNNPLENKMHMPSMHVRKNLNLNVEHSNIPTTQKHRFKSTSLLPSKRFHPYGAPTSNISTQHLKSSECRTILPRNYGEETDSDDNEIFSEITIREKTINNIEKIHGMELTNQHKRGIGIDDPKIFDKKRKEVDSSSQINLELKHKNQNQEHKEQNHASKETQDIINNKKQAKNTDFEFIKPQCPVRKSNQGRIKEVLLAKSAQPLIQKQSQPPECVEEKTKDHPCENSKSELSQQSEDVSMRPSFIKRKLYSKKLDLMEGKNVSTDNIVANSPQGNVYSAIQKEKHKTRKVVTNQSCLNRDVFQEDKNLLDLIHKIVPPDRMNRTSLANKTDVNYKNNLEDEDKWDVTSVITTCNNDDVSDTYTDEEIFKTDDNILKTKNNVNIRNIKNKHSPLECKVVVKKLSESNKSSHVQKKTETMKGNTSVEQKDLKKNKIYKCVKSFWDTDFESDSENHEKKSNTQVNTISAIVNHKKINTVTKQKNVLKVNNHLEKVPVLSNKSLNRTRQSPKLMKCCIEPAVSKPKQVAIDAKKSKEANLKQKQNNIQKKTNTSVINKIQPSKKIILEINSSSNDSPMNKVTKKKNNTMHVEKSLNLINSSLDSTTDKIINRSSLRTRNVSKNRVQENDVEKSKQGRPNIFETTFRTLRSRQIDLSSSITDKSNLDEENNQKKNNRKSNKSRKKTISSK